MIVDEVTYNRGNAYEAQLADFSDTVRLKDDWEKVPRTKLEMEMADGRRFAETLFTSPSMSGMVNKNVSLPLYLEPMRVAKRASMYVVP